MIEAAKEVGPALFFSLVIITLSFLPVFTLQAQEGRLFRPLAFTKTFAMAASAVLAITIIPVLMTFFIRGRIPTEQKNPLSRFFIWAYHPFIEFVLRFPKTVILVAVLTTAVTWFPFQRLGSEFMPPLYEGDFLWMPTTDPGISITKGREVLQQTNKIIASFPEVHHVFGKIGRAETATDPAPLEHARDDHHAQAARRVAPGTPGQVVLGIALARMGQGTAWPRLAGTRACQEPGRAGPGDQ